MTLGYELIRDTNGRIDANAEARRRLGISKGTKEMPSLAKRILRRTSLDEYGRTRPLAADAAPRRFAPARRLGRDLRNWDADEVNADDIEALVELLSRMSGEDIQAAIERVESNNDPDDPETGTDEPPPFKGRPEPGGGMTTAESERQKIDAAQDAAYERRLRPVRRGLHLAQDRAQPRPISALAARLTSRLGTV